MITFYFDCSSPWTWLAFHNIQPMAKELGVDIDWRPVLVGGVFNAVNDSVYEARKAGPNPKARYHAKDLQDWARFSGLSIRMPPSVFPVNSVKVMRACILLKPEGKLADFATAAFETYWTDDLDISKDEVVRDICVRAGVDASHVLNRIQDPSLKDQLRANTDELIARGGFGSPTMFVGDDMYFGNDRLVLVADAVRRAQEA